MPWLDLMYTCTSTEASACTGKVDRHGIPEAKHAPSRGDGPLHVLGMLRISTPPYGQPITTPCLQQEPAKSPSRGVSAVEKQAERGKGHGLMVCTDRGEVSEAGLGSRLRLGKMQPLGGWCDGIIPLLLARLSLPRELAVVRRISLIQGHAIPVCMLGS